MRLAAEHFCPWYVESAARDRDGNLLRIGGCVYDDEVLAAGFADKARIAAIAADVLSDALPHAVEHRRAAGEVDAGELGRVEQLLRDLHGVAWQEVDDAGGHAGRLEEAHRVIAAQHRRRCRLPDHRIPHDRGRGRQIAANRGEVERRDCVDEALQRPVLHLVPHAGAAHRLLVIQLLREVRVESPEVDHL